MLLISDLYISLVQRKVTLEPMSEGEDRYETHRQEPEIQLKPSIEESISNKIVLKLTYGYHWHIRLTSSEKKKADIPA